jgi:flavin reductase (DIM6/NTAB) family NADH-FMN oxidoreductase RutF
MEINKDAIESLPKTKKIHLINAITGFKPVNLIASKSKGGQENVGIFSSVVHLGSSPALIGFILRPTTVRRDTYENIVETGYYTINHVNSAIIDKAHQTSASYGQYESEFDKVQLTAEYLDGYHAPFVKESHIRMGLKLEEIKNIELNDTKLIIGSIEMISIPNDHVIHEHGFLDLELADTVVLSGLDGYYSPKFIKRKSYAVTGLMTRDIEKDDSGK